MEKFKDYKDMTKDVLNSQELQKIDGTNIVILRSDLGKNVMSFANADLSAIKAKGEKATEEIFKKIPEITDKVVMNNGEEKDFFEIKSNLKPESYFEQAA